MIEYIKGYDSWKTRLSQIPDEPIKNCVMCNEELYDGDTVFDIGGDIYCKYCGNEMFKKVLRRDSE